MMDLELSRETQQVQIVDINMPFWSMVGFMVKWAFATIPALLVLMVVGTFVFLFLGGLLK